MGTITSGIGLVSGINTAQIIDQLMALESQPKNLLQTRMDSVSRQKLAYTDLQTRLTSLRLVGTSLKKSATFQSATAKSSNENVLTATTAAGAAVGSYQFQVSRLVTAQQSISQGFTDSKSTPVGAGTITVEMGGGELTSPTLLSQLNGGAGVRLGQFRITDRSGASSVIDVSGSVTLQDVVKKINTSLGVTVKAALGPEGLVLTDLTGKTASNFVVQDLGDGQAAADLGIATIAAGVASNTVTGTDINYLGRSTTLAQINDGRGIRKGVGSDLLFTFGDSSTANVSLASSRTMGDVVDAINTGTGGKIRAELVAGSNGIKLTDTSGLGGTFSVADAGSSKAATDLGLVQNGTGTITGAPLLAGLGSVLISSLRGGSGLDLGQISITDRNGGNATVDLSGAKSVQDILDTLNAAGIGIKASLNASNNGIQIADTTNGTGNLIIAEGNSTTATELGLVTAPAGVAASLVSGANLQKQWISANTQLSDFNGGKGVSAGKFKITNSQGTSTEIDTTSGTKLRLSDIINDINSRQIGVSASINANGDGLLLTDTAGGAGKLTVQNTDGTTATDLNIAGTATGTTIDGSFEKTITVTALDTLTSVQQKINDLNFGVVANIVNDGSGTTPFRLSLTARNSGRDGRVVFDAGATGLGMTTLVEAQDAAVFIGDANASQPLLVTSGTNQIANVIKGVTLQLQGVSSTPVTLSVTQDPQNIVDQLTTFTDAFNSMVDKISELTKFDSTTMQGGLLLGDSTVQTIQTTIYAMISKTVTGAGRYRTLGDMGLKLGDGAKLSFDEEKFRSAFASDPSAVQKLFSTTPITALDSTTRLSLLNSGKGVRTVLTAADFRVRLHDGSDIDVTIGSSNTIGDVLAAINSAGGSKLSAAVTSDGKRIQLTDTTSGTSQLAVGILNGSMAALDLGLTGGTTAATFSSGDLIAKISNVNNTTQGIGYVLESQINRLIDPVSGVLTVENKTLDERTQQFQDRISQMDILLAAKRTRLQTQFSQMETVLAGLQSQSSALSSLSSLTTSSSSSSSSK